MDKSRHLSVQGLLVGLLLFAGGCDRVQSEPQAQNQDQANSQAETTAAVTSAIHDSLSPDVSPVAIPDAEIEETIDLGNQQNISVPDVLLSSATVTESNASKRLGDRLGSDKIVPESITNSIVVDDTSKALNNIVTQLGPLCEPLIAATYQSQRLYTAEHNTTAYFDGRLHKIVTPDSPLRQSDSLDYCYPDLRTTPTQMLVIQRGGFSINIDLEADAEGYVVMNPVSFSADGRYLVASIEVAYTGGDPGVYSALFDLERREKLVMESYICNEADFEEYVGFTGLSEIAFRCSNYGDVEEWIEVLDLQTRSLSKISLATEELQTYGTVIQAFEYTILSR